MITNDIGLLLTERDVTQALAPLSAQSTDEPAKRERADGVYRDKPIQTMGTGPGLDRNEMVVDLR